MTRKEHLQKLPLQKTFKCDGCGKNKPVKDRFKVYNENYRLQKGVYECAECRGI